MIAIVIATVIPPGGLHHSLFKQACCTAPLTEMIPQRSHNAVQLVRRDALLTSRKATRAKKSRSPEYAVSTIGKALSSFVRLTTLKVRICCMVWILTYRRLDSRSSNFLGSALADRL